MVAHAPNMHENECSFNMHRSMGASVFEITCLGSGPYEEEPNMPRRPNWHIKKISIYTRHKNIMANVLTVSCLNSMNTFIRVVSARDWYRTVLTWSNLDNIFHDSCVNNNLATHCFYANNVF